jgi:pilus assembly protein CpaF
MDLRRVNVTGMSDSELRRVTGAVVREIIGNLQLSDAVDAEELEAQVIAESVGLGPLEVLVNRDDISEIMVNSAQEIFYEQNGRIYKSSVTFTDDKAVLAAIERIVVPLGRRIDEASPMVDARLKDGSRVNAVIPPLALKGPCLTIRKFMKEKLTAQHLVQFDSISETMVRFLEMAVEHKRNIVISGGTGSGKTTLLNVLSGFIPSDERIITVEDAAELQLHQPNLVSLEARPANQEGKGAVIIRDLVRNCLRMRPDRIVVGECRGAEALDMLQAMNTGHDGSLTTLHSNSPRDCLGRLEVMVMMTGMDLTITAIREQIASAINIVVQQTRFSCGSRKITSICEVTGLENGRIQLSEIFRFRQKGFDEQGRVKGDFEATGLVPQFYEDLHRRGIEIDPRIFARPGGDI